MKKPDYLTDEELIRLIDSVEADSLLQAPGYLKDSIVQKTIPKRPSHRQHELLFFGAKIVAAAAASIALLFIMPDGRRAGDFTRPGLLAQKETADYVREDSLLRKFNQRANAFCGMISDGANFIFEKEELK